MKPRLDDKVLAPLIITVQTAPAIETTDGTTTWLDTPASRDALADLIDHVYPVVLTWNCTDDQTQAAIEAVVYAARTMVAIPTPSAYLLAVAHKAAKREGTGPLPGVTVNTRTRNRVVAQLRAHDDSLEAAYTDLCVDPSPAITPATFLAAYRALATANLLPADGHATSDFTEETVNHHVVHSTLLPALDPIQRDIILMYYGFTESVSANLAHLMALHGFSPGDQLNDQAISGLRNTTRPAVTRRRQKALAHMRALLEQETS